MPSPALCMAATGPIIWEWPPSGWLPLDIVNIFVKNGTAHAAVASVAMVLTLWAVSDVLPGTCSAAAPRTPVVPHEVRLSRAAPPQHRRQQRMDKDHKYFTCPNCRTVCRVPQRKGQDRHHLAPSATAKSTDGAERPTRPCGRAAGRVFHQKKLRLF